MTYVRKSTSWVGKVTELDQIVGTEQLTCLRQRAREQLGLLYDGTLPSRMEAYIVDQIRSGSVGEGITHAELIRGAGLPTWVAHRGLLEQLLTLVSVNTYERENILITALVRSRRDEEQPTKEFCAFLEDVGLVSSADAREDCVELWDHHWKMVISRYDRGI
ncbi:MAG TPA: hypothetical protein EYO94_01025 [Acidobacteria bacterium]|nr:hypothetical protein [Acidobacteriota bacterium]